MSLVIGIDAAFANLPRKTGVEWYAYHVIRHLAEIDRSTRFRLYTRTPLQDGLCDLPPNFEARVLPRAGSWAHMTLAQELHKNPVGVFYTPAFVLPWHGARPSVFTVHDIAFRHFRSNYSLRQYAHLALNSALSARLASRIVTVSDTVRRDVAKHYGVPEERLVTVHSGFDEDLRTRAPQDIIESEKHAHGLHRPYYAFVGRLDARKNIERIVAAFLHARRTLGLDAQLLLIGQAGPGSARALTLADAHPDDIRRPGYLSNEQRNALLQGALGLVFPSLYEGFGLPILEAFAARIPVITSLNGGACAEVADGAALLVDAYDTSDIAAAMARLAGDAALRAQLVERGDSRLDTLSWRRAAGEIHAVLLDTAARPRGAGSTSRHDRSRSQPPAARHTQSSARQT